jgi:hypothetical protein
MDEQPRNQSYSQPDSEGDRAYSPNGAKSAGQLMKEVTEDLSTLFRKEVDLAKAEVLGGLTEKAKGIAIIAVAGVFGFFALIFLLLAIRDGFDNILPTWLADIATGGVLILIGVIAVLVARKKLATPINPELTKKTLKEDVEFAKSLGRRP